MAKRKPQPSQTSKDAYLESADAALKANKEIYEAGGSAFVGNYTVYPTAPLSGGGLQDHNQAKIIKSMREADQAYREVGIIRNIIDIMTDFAAEGLDVSHPVQSHERFFKAWLKHTKMTEVAKQCLHGMYKWANIGLFRFWGKIRPKTKKEMMAKAKQLLKEGREKEAVKAFFSENRDFRQSVIPIKYVPVPPFQLRIAGSVLFPDRVYFYQLADLDKEKILNPEKFCSPEEVSIIENLNPQIKEMVKKDGVLQIPAENFHMFHYKKDCSRLWADPMIMPIMDDLRYKKVLRRMDVSVAESIINPITIFKLGKTVEGFPPTREMFENLATLLKTPVQTKTLVWNDLIELEQKVVDAKEVFDTEKYRQVNEDILAGLGISQILINGGAGGSNYSNSFLSVRTLLERLEDGRNEFMTFLQNELEYVSKAMGFKRLPLVTWEQMNLRDEAAEQRVIIELLDRKVLSAETALQALGYNHDLEFARKMRENKSSERSGLVHSVGPFEQQVLLQLGEDPSQENVKINKEKVKKDIEIKEKQLKVQKTKVGPMAGPGRPGGKGDPQSRKQKVKRDTKPKGMGAYTPEIMQSIASMREIVEKQTRNICLKAFKLDNLRQMTNEQKIFLNNMIMSIMEQMGNTDKISDKIVDNCIQKYACGEIKLSKEFRELYKEYIQYFKETHHRNPTVAEKSQIIDNVWATLKMSL